MHLRILCLIGLGGFIGSVARYLTTLMLLKFSGTYPLGTLFANMLGGLLIGLFYGLSMRFAWMNNEWRLFLITGLCGGYTTFSAFTLENLQFIQEGLYMRFAVYSLGSFVLCLIAAYAGMLLARV